MKKIQDKVLEKAITEIIKRSKTQEEAAHEIVEKIRNFQDAGGLKLCMPENSNTLD